MSEAKVVLITGASSGFGKVTAELLSKTGYRVFGTSRHPETVQSNGVTMLPLDVRDAKSLQACVQAVMAQAGRLDVLVNNAGYAGPAAASEETDIAQLKAVFETNFFGMVQMTNAVLPIMRKQGGGYILNISSAGGYVAYPFYSAYMASKHAVEGYTEALYYEVEPFNIHAVLIEPGFFKTNIHHTIQEPDFPLDAYASQREALRHGDHYCIEHGRDPWLVAMTISRILDDPAPDLRHPVGLDAQLMMVLKRCLPFSWFARGTKWLTMNGGPNTDVNRGMRRLIMDSKTADRVFPFLAIGVIGALLWGLGRLARRR
ncbi:MAG: SDR family NAD(P)-dependent oxidoreductase [Anaerolineae bacterium]|nr:SDR family NAD(P)-dependent oxidoreductase [Anaerolineae bacterium]